MTGVTFHLRSLLRSLSDVPMGGCDTHDQPVNLSKFLSLLLLLWLLGATFFCASSVDDCVDDYSTGLGRGRESTP